MSKRLLSKLDYRLRQSIELTAANSRLTLAIAGSLFAVALFFTTDLKQLVSVDDQLDPQMTSTLELKEAQRLFPFQNTLGFLLPADSGIVSAQTLCQLEGFTRELRAEFPEVKNALSVLDLRQARVSEGKLFYPSLISSPCEPGSSVPFSTATLQKSFWNNSMISPAGGDVATTMTLDALSRKGKYAHFDPELIEKIIAKSKVAFNRDIEWFGVPVQQLYTLRGLAHAQWLNLLILLVIFLSFRFTLGTWRSGFLFVGTLIFTGVVVYGGMGLAAVPIDPLSSCLFLLITVAALEDFVFLSHAQLDSLTDSPDDDPSAVFKSLALPGFFTSLTTLIAFGSLLLSSLQSVRNFGAWAAFGSVVEWVAVFLLLPALIKATPSLSCWTDRARIKLNLKFSRLLSSSPPRLLSRCLLILLVTAVYSVQHLSLSQTPTEIFPGGHPMQKIMESIRDSRGWVGEAQLIFEVSLSNERRAEIVKTLSQNTVVSGTDSFSGFISFISAKVTDPLTREMIEREVRATKVSERYFAESGEEQVVLYLKTTNTEKLNALRDQTRNLCPKQQCWLSGTFIAYADFSKNLMKTLFDSLFLSLLLVAATLLFLCFASGQLKHFFEVVLSSFWGPAVLLTMLFTLRISVNFVTCIVASVLVGLTGDNAVQFLLAQKQGSIKDGISKRESGAIQCSLMMALCSLTLVFSYFEPPRALGVLLAAGFLFALAGDLWLLRGLLKTKKSQH